MKIPAIQGLIRRRILLNYRIDPDVARAALPEGFSPLLKDGFAIGGICLIRLEQVRPKRFPNWFTLSGENTAHRFATEWTDDQTGEKREGVFVNRRDTNSFLISLAGGKVFPGVHHHSRFEVEDSDGAIKMQVSHSGFDVPLADLEVTETDEFPADSVFDSIEDSSSFFEGGCVGYSTCPGSDKLDGLLLKIDDWQVTPLKIQRATSAYFDDHSIFPSESIQLDHALLMRDIPHEWHSEPEMHAAVKSNV